MRRGRWNGRLQCRWRFIIRSIGISRRVIHAEIGVVSIILRASINVIKDPLIFKQDIPLCSSRYLSFIFFLNFFILHPMNTYRHSIDTFATIYIKIYHVNMKKDNVWITQAVISLTNIIYKSVGYQMNWIYNFKKIIIAQYFHFNYKIIATLKLNINILLKIIKIYILFILGNICKRLHLKVLYYI